MTLKGKIFVFATLVLVIILFSGINCVPTSGLTRTVTTTPSLAPTTPALTPKYYSFSITPSDSPKSPQTLNFPMQINDRVDGIVEATPNNIYVDVIDPYGNKVIESLRYERSYYFEQKYGSPVWRRDFEYIQKYPWRFAFVAAIQGEYSLVLGAIGKNTSAKVSLIVFSNQQ